MAVLTQLLAKPDKVDKVVDTFLATYQRDHEIWMALRHTDSPLAFTTFDAAADGGPDLNGLLQSPPVTQSVKIMRTHTKVTIPNTEKTAGAPVGLVIFLKAKPGKADAVRELVFSTVFSFIEEEEKTLIWFGLEYPDTPGLFGILDFFTDEEGRKIHMAGKAAQAVLAATDELLTEPADFTEVDVVATKIMVQI
ncbi:uncharacterized protein EV420DRAFT_1476944 [Desarmillaria tabescens]|uniref:ABM domain-containing protein n=1 Tax=Armillaria tabescens TaxID=1929756 RepID=A0AA39NCQ5_ARMTA|nr:uncharacterized protein EV420DRAFT_1476944 [Desarmillaria tabescens]KAK0463233.1 hypothetical protein EV420DRAFT_1476944 [Desarmillaria tabescens]